MSISSFSGFSSVRYSNKFSLSIPLQYSIKSVSYTHLGTMTIEVFKDGKSVTNQTLKSNGLAAPYTLKMAVQGNLLTVYREKDGQ